MIKMKFLWNLDGLQVFLVGTIAWLPLISILLQFILSLLFLNNIAHKSKIIRYFSTTYFLKEYHFTHFHYHKMGPNEGKISGDSSKQWAGHTSVCIFEHFVDLHLWFDFKPRSSTCKSTHFQEKSCARACLAEL